MSIVSRICWASGIFQDAVVFCATNLGILILVKVEIFISGKLLSVLVFWSLQ